MECHMTQLTFISSANTFLSHFHASIISFINFVQCRISSSVHIPPPMYIRSSQKIRLLTMFIDYDAGYLRSSQ